MTKRKIVLGMVAAQACIERLERRQILPSGLLKQIALVMGDDTGRLALMTSSAFRSPTELTRLPNGSVVEQRECAIAFLDNFIDDCRFMLAESEPARG